MPYYCTTMSTYKYLFLYFDLNGPHLLKSLMLVGLVSCLSFQWLTGSTHKLAHHERGARLMGRETYT